jgi:hypothetical protein
MGLYEGFCKIIPKFYSNLLLCGLQSITTICENSILCHCLKCSQEKVEDGSFRSQIQSTNLASEGYHQGSWSQRQVYDPKWMLYVQLQIQKGTRIRFYAPQDTELSKLFKAHKILKSEGSIPTGTNSGLLIWREVKCPPLQCQPRVHVLVA